MERATMHQCAWRMQRVCTEEGRLYFHLSLNPSRQVTSLLSPGSMDIYTEFLKPNCTFEQSYKDLKNADTPRLTMGLRFNKPS